MDREIVFAILGALSIGPMLILFGHFAPGAVQANSSRDMEQLRWRALWFPMLPVAILIAAGLGWAFEEPSASEALPLWVTLTAIPFGLVWVRAFTRACKAACVCPPVAMAVAGLIWPRIIIAPSFLRSADRHAFRAALLHEHAHMHHRDPLRIWVAQFATDLQWPCRHACDRFAAWREALELARDEEARMAGADGADLAAAILQVARTTPVTATNCAAITAIHDGSVAVEDRVRRLLDDLPPCNGVCAFTLFRVSALALGIAWALGAGSAWGERFIQVMFGF